MPSSPRIQYPYYLQPGFTITLRHAEHGKLCATILPFSASVKSSTHVVLVKLAATPRDCPLRPETPYIVKLFDPRFMRGPKYSWTPEVEAAAARMHGGEMAFNPRQIPWMGDVDYDEDRVGWERLWFEHTAWMHHNECLAYKHLARLQGDTVPTFYGSGTLDLSNVDPARSISPFVLFLGYVRDAVPLNALDPRLFSEALMRAIISNGSHLKAHGIVHTDPNPANFLVAPAHAPTRVVVIDFAECWTRDAVDEGEWDDAAREWDVEHHRRVMLRRLFLDAELPVPELVRLPKVE